ncbi:MAG: sulfatase-like hydrolase/transferase [Pseudomonadota bacterium]|nr:sulfatase-like hydrolase/transferase [Pseudomonadota bacterium]
MGRAPHRPPNLLVIMSDEHRKDAMGCAGHPLVRTPHLDGLAARGTRFTNAYTSSPMCVPTRAALACGDHVHRTGFWDSATPYDGSATSWMHRVRDADHDMVSIGKLHFRSSEDDNGFSEEILPMHVVGGVGWMAALLREDPPAYGAAAELAADSGAGSSSYTDYDLAITTAATDWISARRDAERPWAAFVSLVSPHFPLTAPQQFYDLYADADFDIEPRPLPDHPEIRNLARFFDYERHFTAETRHAATAGYFGLTSFLDDCVGEILATLEEIGQAEDTVILYLSDHGELLGDKGMWTKQVMYEASAGIPMILAGPGVPDGIVRNTAASIVDVAATALDVMLDTSDDSAPGLSLRQLAQDPDDADRTVLCEYHDGGSTTGAFMVRWGDWKYVCYPGMPPQLFNLAEDPSEDHDLGTDMSARAVAARAEGAARLAAICDADAVNRRCFADQAARIEALGGLEACRNARLFNHTPTPAEQQAMHDHGGQGS